MDENIKVSIIIPVYNVEAYLPQCLDSALNQTMDEIEIIAINDGSIDRSREILEDYSSKYSNVIVINQDNRGQGNARNNGLELAKGEFIYFLDSDDFIELNAIEELYNEAKLNDLDVVLFDGVPFYEGNLKVKKKNSYKKKVKYPDVQEGKKMFAKLIYNKEYTCSPCLIFIRKKVLDNQQLKFFEGIIQEDELFTFQLLLLSRRVKHIDKSFFHRRVREGSTMTGNNFLKSFNGYRTVLYRMIDFMNNLNIKDDYIKGAVNTKIGYIFGGAINRYIYLSKNYRKDNLNAIHDLQETAKKMGFFGKKEYALFYYSIGAYCLLRKIYERIK